MLIARRRCRSSSRKTLAAAVVLVLVAAACGDDDAATTPSTSTVTTGSPVTVTLEQALLGVAEAHIAAFNAGDADALMGLFAPDVRLGNSFDAEITVTDWEMILAWNIAQGTILTAADCTVTLPPTIPGIVTCESGTHIAPAQAIGAPPLPTTLTFLIVPQGDRADVKAEILELESVFQGVSRTEPDIFSIQAPFERWLRSAHPEDADRVGFGLWNSVEEAEQNGLLSAQYAEEWAAFLDAADCVYPDICYRILTEG